MYSVGKNQSTVSQQTQPTLSMDKMHASKICSWRELCWINYLHHLKVHFIEASKYWHDAYFCGHPSTLLKKDEFIYFLKGSTSDKSGKVKQRVLCGQTVHWRWGFIFFFHGLVVRPLVCDVAPLVLFLSLCTSVILHYLLQQYASICKHSQK